MCALTIALAQGAQDQFPAHGFAIIECIDALAGERRRKRSKGICCGPRFPAARRSIARGHGSSDSLALLA